MGSLSGRKASPRGSRTIPTQRLIGVVMIAATLLVSVVAFGGRASAVTQYQIGTFNMAGGHSLGDQPGHGIKGDEAPAALVASVEDRQPAFMMLQEACRDWIDRVDGALADYTAAFEPAPRADGSVESAQCKHPTDFGTAILYRNDFGVDQLPAAYDLGLPEMKCVAASARMVVICTAHFTAGDSDQQVAARTAESGLVIEALARDYAGHTVFLGGDFNAEPQDDVNDLFYHVDYGGGATGQFKEVDSPCGNDIAETTTAYIGENPVAVSCRDGESTHDDVWIKRDWVPDVEIEEGPLNNKIDYLFVSPSVQVLSADATFGIHSDHDPLWADVAF
jgi:endonuclease/exonuclease/phosphatase family metal-dependent hydrolase